MTECVIQVFGTLSEQTVRTLLGVINQHRTQGITEFTLLLSSRGGNTMAGHFAYHELKALAINLTTWNMGLVGSAAISLYCAGKRRYSVPEAGFWLHCPDWTFQARVYDLTELRAIADEMERDLCLNAQILAANCDQQQEALMGQMCSMGSWTPMEAVARGLAQEVRQPAVAGPVIVIQ